MSPDFVDSDLTKILVSLKFSVYGSARAGLLEWSDLRNIAVALKTYAQVLNGAESLSGHFDHVGSLSPMLTLLPSDDIDDDSKSCKCKAFILNSGPGRKNLKEFGSQGVWECWNHVLDRFS